MRAFCLMSTVVAVAFFLLPECRSGRPVVEIGGYTFPYQGKEYRIESVTPNTMEGYNILTRKENDELVLKAIDKEQDGVIDEIVAGAVSLDEANAIYQEGIREGGRRGFIKNRSLAREYRTSDARAEYVLATYVLVMGGVYNRLTIIERRFVYTEASVVDSDADGMLDLIEKGLGTLGGYQKIYRQILEHGMHENKVIKTERQYLVIK